MEPIDHPVSRYALGVLEGDIVAGDLVRMACERHLMDLETGADRGLFFDCQAASRIINWASMLQHTTGPMSVSELQGVAQLALCEVKPKANWMKRSDTIKAMRGAQGHE